MLSVFSVYVMPGGYKRLSNISEIVIIYINIVVLITLTLSVIPRTVRDHKYRSVFPWFTLIL